MNLKAILGAVILAWSGYSWHAPLCAAVIGSGDPNAGVSLERHPDMLYPWNHDYSGMMTVKPVIDWGNTFNDHRGPELDLMALLEWARKIDNLTRGVPKLFLIVGAQEGGHDAQYPYLASLNPKLKRPQDPSVKDSFNWFIREARNCHCTVSFHVNCLDAYADSPIFKQYADEGLIIRNADGTLRPHGAWAGRTAYRVNLVAEWKKGFLQKRLNQLLEALPELKKSGVIYFDANVNFLGDPGDRTSAEDQLNAFRTMCCWLKARHDVDVMGEYTYPALYGFSSVGYTRPSGFGNHRLDSVPAYLASGGRPNSFYDVTTALFGYNTQVDGTSQHTQSWSAPEKDPRVAEFYYYTLPYVFVNRLLCLEVVPNESVTFSDGVVRCYDKKTGQIIMLQDGKPMQVGNDVFIPAVWRANREIIAYSHSGRPRTWSLPQSWNDVKAADIYRLTTGGPVLLERARDIADHAIPLALEAGQAVTIVPAGADLNANPVPVAEGKATLIGIDATTKGDWRGRYGSEGWSLAGANPQLPSGVRISYVGFKDSFIAIDPTSKLAPQNPAAPNERLGVVKTAFLNGLIDVDLGRDHETEVAVYLANLDDRPRKTLVEALEPSTRKVLAATVVVAADYGTYVRFNVKGHVLLRVTKLLGLGGAAGEAPMISGVLLGRAASEPPPWSLQLDPGDCKSGWREARVDASVTGTPLSIGGTQFDRGVGTHAPSVWSASLRGSAAQFGAKVGVQNGGQTVEFIVRGDGKTLFRSGVMKGGEKAKDVDVSLKGIQSLSLEVTDGGDGNSGDHANWISPHIVPAAE